MKKVFQTKLKSITKVLTLVIIASLATFTGCTSYDEDITKLNGDITSLKAELKTLQDGAVASATAKITALEAEVTALKGKVTTLETSGATDAEVATAIAAAKADILNKTVSIEIFNEYKKTVTADIAKAIATLATKEEVDAKIVEVNKSLAALGAEVTTLKGELTTAIADLAALKGDVVARIVTLEALTKVSNDKITANAKEITALKTSLTSLQALANGNATAITELQEKLALANTAIEALSKKIDVELAVVSRRLTSLTYVPTLFVNGIEAINFSPLIAPCTTITPSLTVAYHLNPSFIKVEDIDINHLSFKLTEGLVSNIQFAPGASNANNNSDEVKATFVKIEGGKIYVSVKVEQFNEVFAGNVNGGLTEKFKMIALQVPLSDKVTGSPEDRYITSSYVRLYSQSLLASNISINKNVSAVIPYPTTLQAAKDLKVFGVDSHTGADDLTIIHIPYNQQNFSLLDKVKALYSNAGFDISTYGLVFKFDEKTPKVDGSENQDIVYNRTSSLTNQQEFIDVTEAGVVTVKVYTDAQIAAAQGRTPLVRVKLVDPLSGCIVSSAYIKLYLDEKPAKAAVTVPVFNLGETDNLCVDYSKIYTTAEYINVQFYNAVGLSKEEFVAIYKLVQTPDPVIPLNNDGVFEEIVDLVDPTTSNLLKWSVSSSTIWSKLGSASSYTFVDSAKYVPADAFKTLYPAINFSVKLTVKKPTASILGDDSKILEYWFDEGAAKDVYIKHNIAVPTVAQTDKTKGVFVNDLAAAFTATSISGLTSANFYFYATQPYGFVVADAGKTLKSSVASGSETIATISGSVLTLNRDSEIAKTLLNAGVSHLFANIGITAKYCNGDVYNVKVSGADYFPVKFVRPIAVEKAETAKFIDGNDFGGVGTFLDINTMVTFKDWRDFAFNTNSTYYQYYGIENITIDENNIKTNLNSTTYNAISNFQFLEVRVVGTYPNSQLTYKNNGQVLNSGFKLEVPVTVTYYWGKIESAKIYIDVEKTVGGSSSAKKK